MLVLLSSSSFYVYILFVLFILNLTYGNMCNKKVQQLS
jgi:hypothetical protein